MKPSCSRDNPSQCSCLCHRTHTQSCAWTCGVNSTSAIQALEEPTEPRSTPRNHRENVQSSPQPRGARTRRPWEDPLPEAGERHLAQELRGVGLAGFEQPEWKTAALGKAPTYGIADSRSIKEQRESLPIFRFRDELLSAIHDNQVC